MAILRYGWVILFIFCIALSSEMGNTMIHDIPQGVVQGEKVRKWKVIPKNC